MAGVDEPFIGRAWLAEAVRSWAGSDARYLFITGHPGAGKSAAVDHLWGEEPVTGTVGVAVHRCRATDRRSCDPVRFAESVAEQLSQTLPGFTDALMRVSTELSGRTGDVHIEGSASAGTVHPNGTVIGVRITIANVSADEAFERLVARPLARLAPEPLPVVVVDALDEALTYRAHRTIAELVLDGIDGLPARFVVTSRHDERVTAAQARIAGAASLDLVADAPDAEGDLAEYAAHRLRDLVTDGAERERHARRLSRLGAGSFLYVHHLTAELIAGRRALADLDDVRTLPGGLEDLYGQFLRREIRPLGNLDAEERWRRDFRPMLSLLVAVQGEGFSAGQLAGLLDTSEQSVLDVIRVLRQYLQGPPGGPWMLYHRSFAEFLVKGPDALLEAAEGHHRIADFAFAEWTDDWAGCDDLYYVRHLPHHLMSALEGTGWTRSRLRALRDRLYALATSEPFLAAQRGADPDREPHLATITLALESSLGAGEADRVAVLVIALVGAQADTDAVTPVQAALTWGLDAGVAKARSYPEESSLLWHLLILAAMGMRNPDDAGPVATVIGRSGFGTVGDGWQAALAMLLAPFLPALGVEQAQAVLAVSDDFMLGYLGYFLLEWIKPDFAVVPVLCIDEALPRARAFTEIVTQFALAGAPASFMSDLGGLIMDDFETRQRRYDRALGRDGDASPLKSYLLTPDVPAAVLVAEAARGRFEETRRDLTDKDGIYRYRTGADDVLLGHVVDATVNSGAAVDRLREAGEGEIARTPGYPWCLMHYVRYLQTVNDPRVPELLDRIVELSKTGDQDYVWEMYAGHLDAFHGGCDVGLRLALVRALCADGRTVEAAREAENMRSANPTEYIRALSYVHDAEPDEAAAAAVLASARQAADDQKGGLTAQTMLVLLDNDFDRLLAAVSAQLVRAGDGTHRASATTLSLLAWAAHRRGDRKRAEKLGRRAVAEFSARAEDARLPGDQARLVRNLLRAGLPKEARRAVKLATTTWGSRIVLLPPDVPNSLIRSAEVEQLRALRSALGQPPEPGTAEGRDPVESQAARIRYLRAAGQPGLLNRELPAAQASLEDALDQMVAEIRMERGQYADSFSDEAGAARLAHLAADLGDHESVDTALRLMRTWAHEAEMSNMSWDAFRGHFPRADEYTRDSDKESRRLCQVCAHVAEAYHHAGDGKRAQHWYGSARNAAGNVQTSASRLNAFVELAEIAARCGWYAELAELRPELTRVRGSALGSVAEILVVAALRGDAAARRAFEEILMDRSLVNIDYADLLALLAVLSGDAGVENRLLAAVTA
ncbi:P-loop domain-containing protein [Micromonospora aurantiaca (nom. illeg.)]|uniref:hypothetical protein n=1 Tax=Micromonospora aurantiaca (nom. illeg.) TaxID=47850 RepID=UPI001622D6BA